MKESQAESFDDHFEIALIPVAGEKMAFKCPLCSKFGTFSGEVTIEFIEQAIKQHMDTFHHNPAIA